MNAHAITVRLRLDAPELELRDVVPVFHRWIREGALSGELLIDVVDYSHVHRGPGVLLIGHTSNIGIGIDDSDGRLGLTYSRQREAVPVEPERRLVEAAHRALIAARAFEESVEIFEKVRVGTDVWEIRIADRLRAPNTPKTLARLEPELRALFELMFDGAAFDVEHLDDAKRLFAARVTTDSAAICSIGIAGLLARLDATREAA
ncbi:MAG: hypothetical protein V3T05_01430 [Myxococcota bacterium]